VLLEERLEVRHILRPAHRLILTEAGRNFYERAKRALKEADEADRVARDITNGLSGRVRVSAPIAFARLHIRIAELLYAASV
jgi:DNA-binding transcriptional LysR family regulator